MNLQYFIEAAARLFEHSFGDEAPDLSRFSLELAGVASAVPYSAIIGLAALYPMCHKMDVTVILAGPMESPVTLAHALKQISEGVSLAPITHHGSIILPTRQHMRDAVPSLYLDAYQTTDQAFTDFALEQGMEVRALRRMFKGGMASKSITPEHADPRALITHVLHRN